MSKPAIRNTSVDCQSQFVEMFDGKEFPVKRLSDECETITKGTTPTTIGYNFTDTGVNFVKIENITSDGRIVEDGMMHISLECNDMMKRSQLEEGDILFSIAGAIGRSAVVASVILPANINQALAIIRLKKESPLSRGFLMAMLQFGYVEKQYLELKRGVAQLNLSLKDVGNFIIPIPPIERQEEFVSFADQIDKSKYERLVA